RTRAAHCLKPRLALGPPFGASLGVGAALLAALLAAVLAAVLALLATALRAPRLLLRLLPGSTCLRTLIWSTRPARRDHRRYQEQRRKQHNAPRDPGQT